MNTLQTLLKGALGHKVPAEFAAENYDYESALRDELKKLASNMSQFRRNKYDIFDLLAQEWEEVLPQSIQEALGLFCEVIHVDQGQRLEFRVKKGHQRGKQFVTRATESGSYEYFRLDHDRFDVYPFAIGAAGHVDFERYLDGLEDMAEIYQIIQEGTVDRVFELVQNCLLESWNRAGRPAKNKVAVNGFDVQAMRDLCNTVAPYGSPIIYCSPEFAAEMTNVYINTAAKVSEAELLEVRDRGYIGKFYSYPVVVLPQSFTDENNEKLVKIGIEGSPYFREWENRDNSMEIQGYAKIGVGMINRPNYWGIYYNAAIEAGGWEEYNKTIVADEEIQG